MIKFFKKAGVFVTSFILHVMRKYIAPFMYDFANNL